MSEEKKQELHISEVKSEDSIAVTAMMGRKQIDLQVTYANLSEDEFEGLQVNYGNHFLPIEVVTQEVNGEEVPITFEGQNSVLHVVVVNRDGVFKFDHVNIKKYSFPGGRTIHLINALAPIGVKFNRRRGVRVDLDTRMELEQGEDKFIILVRELSFCGFSFVNLSTEEIDPSRPFVLNLIERDGEKSFSVGKFIGKVHRVTEVDNGNKVYGCILADKHANYLQKYITMKQMEAINGKRAFADIQKTSSGENWRVDVVGALGRTLDEEEVQDNQEDNQNPED